jgi:hypothetical protein
MYFKNSDEEQNAVPTNYGALKYVLFTMSGNEENL